MKEGTPNTACVIDELRIMCGGDGSNDIISTDQPDQGLRKETVNDTSSFQPECCVETLLQKTFQNCMHASC